MLQTLEMRISQLEDQNISSRRFTVENFSKTNEAFWIPSMYTHIPGYRFSCYIHRNGTGSCENEAMLVDYVLCKENMMTS